MLMYDSISRKFYLYIKNFSDLRELSEPKTGFIDFDGIKCGVSKKRFGIHKMRGGYRIETIVAIPCIFS